MKILIPILTMSAWNCLALDIKLTNGRVLEDVTVKDSNPESVDLLHGINSRTVTRVPWGMIPDETRESIFKESKGVQISQQAREELEKRTVDLDRAGLVVSRLTEGGVIAIPYNYYRQRADYSQEYFVYCDTSRLEGDDLLDFRKIYRLDTIDTGKSYGQRFVVRYTGDKGAAIKYLEEWIASGKPEEIVTANKPN